MKRFLQIAIGLTAIIGLGFSAKAMRMGLDCYAGQVFSTLCSIGTGKASSCSPAICGSWGKVFGVSNGTWGTLFHFAFLVTWIFAFLRDNIRDRLNSLLFILSGFAVAYAIFMAILLTFVVKVPCPICIGFYISAIVNLILTFLITRDLEKGRIATAINAVRSGLKHREALAMTIVVGLVCIGLIGVINIKETRARDAALKASLAQKKQTNSIIQETPTAIGAGIDTPKDRLTALWQYYLSPPIKPEFVPSDATGQVFGNPKGSVTLYVFTDFECPFCRRMELELKAQLPQMPQLRIIRKDYPLDHKCNDLLHGRPFHQYSCKASMFALCAGEQDLYWNAHDLLMENVHRFEEKGLWEELGKGTGGDWKQMQACMNDRGGPAFKAMRNDLAEGNRLMLEGTPSMVMNDRMIVLPAGPAEIQQLVKVMTGQKPDIAPPLDPEDIQKYLQGSQ